MTKSILNETAEIIKKIGAPVQPDVEGMVWGLIEKLPCGTKSSYAVDIENNSMRNEGEIFGTAIIELGKKLNVKTNTIEMVFNEIELKKIKKQTRRCARENERNGRHCQQTNNSKKPKCLPQAQHRHFGCFARR